MHGQTKVEQDRMAIRSQQDIGRLQIMVADVLFMQAVDGLCDGRSYASDLLDAGGDGAHPSRIQPLLQTLPLDVLHDQVRQACHVAGSDKPRNMRSVDVLQNLMLDFEAHDVL